MPTPSHITTLSLPLILQKSGDSTDLADRFCLAFDATADPGEDTYYSNGYGNYHNSDFPTEQFVADYTAAYGYAPVFPCVFDRLRFNP